jgi:hypothetical protein
MRRSILLLLAVLLLSSYTNQLSWNEKITQAAQKGLPVYLGMIPPGMKEKYGFFSGDDLKKCTIGKPFRVLSPSRMFYNSQEEPDITKNASLIQIANEWRVPVLCNNRSRTLLTVTSNMNECQVVDLGGAVLAQELQQVSADAGKDDDLYLLRIYPLAADFFVNAKTGSINDAGCIPLTSATMAMPSLKQRKTYTLNDVLSIVKSTLDKQAKN